MSEDHRIGEDQICPIGAFPLQLSCAAGLYTLDFDGNPPHKLWVSDERGKDFWLIQRIYLENGCYSLMGMTGLSEAYLADACWFELVLTHPAIMTFYGDRQRIRVDYQVDADGTR